MFLLRRFVKLKYLIVAVISLAFVLSVIVSTYSSYQGNVKFMEEQALENNRVYALKLSETVDQFIGDTKRVMRYSASEIGDDFNNMEKLQQEVNRLYSQEKTFSSVVVVDADANILVNAPQDLGLAGSKVTSKEGLDVLNKRTAYITNPYMSPTGNEIILLSMPVYDKEGIFKGVVNGTIYLHKSDIFEMVLGRHPYENGSYVYVVDTNGKIIYHPNKARLGENASKNEVVEDLIKEKSGAKQIVNSLDQPMLAGYSSTERTRWGIVVQTPYDEAINAVGKQVSEVFARGLPFIILSTIFVFILASRVVRPLQNMAEIAGNSAQEQEMNKLKDIRAWYFEVFKIREALIQSFSILHGQVNTLKKESSTDPLTKLLNRRTFDKVIHLWTEQQKPYTLVIIDVDYFKKVNDSYGHTIGDDVLQFIASKLKEVVGKEDLACRYGGEEFILLLAEETVGNAYSRVEAFRQEISQLISPTGEVITFSAGIANYPLHGDQPKMILEKADAALYEAKKNGRNRVEVTNA